MAKRPIEDGERQQQQRDSRRQALAYQGAFEAVIAVLVAGGIGHLADRRFGSEPTGLLIGVAVGFGSFVLRLLRLGEQLRKLEAEQEQTD